MPNWTNSRRETLVGVVSLIAGRAYAGQDTSLAQLEFLATTYTRPLNTLLVVGGRKFQVRLGTTDDYQLGVASGIELEVKEPGVRHSPTNLLEPSGYWHGYQPFMFMGWDYAKGPGTSTFGAVRTTRRGNIVITTTVKDVTVSVAKQRAADGTIVYQLDRLSLVVGIAA
jgi:hypothetical protein